MRIPTCSTLSLQTVVAQCRFALKPDGLLLAALLGGDSLQELRISCALAQMEVMGGVSPVVSPFAQVGAVSWRWQCQYVATLM